jgi:hypothetical protein
MPAGLIGGIASIAGGVIQAGAANRARKDQQNAANRQFDLQERIYDESSARLQPWQYGGLDAQNALAFELGLGERPMIGGSTPGIESISAVPGTVGGFGGGTAGTPGSFRVGDMTFATRAEAEAYANSHRTGGTAYGGYMMTPGAQFQMREGTATLDRGAAARGNVFSGNTIKAQTDYTTGVVQQDYGNYLSRLAGMSGSGQNAAAMQGAAGANFAQGGSNALANYGNAGAAGAIGVGNAWNSAIGNGLSAWQYQQGLNRPQTNSLAGNRLQSGVY